MRVYVRARVYVRERETETDREKKGGGGGVEGCEGDVSAQYVIMNPVCNYEPKLFLTKKGNF